MLAGIAWCHAGTLVVADTRQSRAVTAWLITRRMIAAPLELVVYNG
jgi:hypothetical protein